MQRLFFRFLAYFNRRFSPEATYFVRMLKYLTDKQFNEFIGEWHANIINSLSKPSSSGTEVEHLNQISFIFSLFAGSRY